MNELTETNTNIHEKVIELKKDIESFILFYKHGII